MTADPRIQQAAIAGLVTSGLLASARLSGPRDIPAWRQFGLIWAIAGQVRIQDREVTLIVGLDRNFPQSLPKIFLSPSGVFGPIPHILDGGVVCYAATEGLVLNARDPAGLILEAVERAVGVLEDGVAGRNRMDLMDEFGAYWVRVVTEGQLLSFIKTDNHLRRALAFRRGKAYQMVADLNQQYIGQFGRKGQVLKTLNQCRALYVPLEEGVFVLPPSPGHMWSAADIKDIVDTHLSCSNREALIAATQEWSREELVVISLPRPAGDRTLIALLYQNIKGGHPLRCGRSDKPIPLGITRCDPEYVLPRGGARWCLHEKRVLLVGCGSVGGFLAFAMARSGLGAITLVDPDVLMPENIYRHVLGESALGSPKAEAVKREIEAKYPYIKVAAHPERIQDVLRAHPEFLNQFDLVLLALGDPTVELWINRLLHGARRPLSAVFTWLEPYGIGGHALLTRPGQRGCYECLFAPAYSETPLANRAAFAEYGQEFGTDNLGCGTRYTPYTAIDAEKTANMAAALSLDALSDREEGSPLESWKGPAEEFQARGFRVSGRYSLSADQLHNGRYHYISANCPVCGGWRP